MLHAFDAFYATPTTPDLHNLWREFDIASDEVRLFGGSTVQPALENAAALARRTYNFSNQVLRPEGKQPTDEEQIAAFNEFLKACRDELSISGKRFPMHTNTGLDTFAKSSSTEVAPPVTPVSDVPDPVMLDSALRMWGRRLID